MYCNTWKSAGLFNGFNTLDDFAKWAAKKYKLSTFTEAAIFQEPHYVKVNLNHAFPRDSIAIRLFNGTHHTFTIKYTF